MSGGAADAGVEVQVCVHCAAEVRQGEQGDWIHAHGLYRCQSTAVPYGHLAHPSGVPCRADGPNPCLGARSVARCWPTATAEDVTTGLARYDSTQGGHDDRHAGAEGSVAE